MHNNAAKYFFPLSVIPPMPKFGSKFRITDPYLGGQLFTDPSDPDLKHCRNLFQGWGSALIYCGSGFSIFPNCGSGSSSESRVLMTKNWKNSQLKKGYFFEKNCNLLTVCLQKGRTIYRRSRQPSEKNIQHVKTWNFLLFSMFVGHFSWFLPSWIRIQQLKLMGIQIHNPACSPALSDPSHAEVPCGAHHLWPGGLRRLQAGLRGILVLVWKGMKYWVKIPMQAVLRIHDILIWIRIRILLFSSLTFTTPTKK